MQPTPRCPTAASMPCKGTEAPASKPARARAHVRPAQVEVAPAAAQLGSGDLSVEDWSSKFTLEAVRDMAVNTQL